MLRNAAHSELFYPVHVRAKTCENFVNNIYIKLKINFPAASKFYSYQSQEVFVPAYFYSAVQENKGANAWLYEFA